MQAYLSEPAVCFPARWAWIAQIYKMTSSCDVTNREQLSDVSMELIVMLILSHLFYF